MDIGPGCAISFSARLDKSYPRGIHIGEGTAINFGAVRSDPRHPARRSRGYLDWKECNIGANSIIMAGVRVGDNCVVAAASVVMKDVPSNCLVAGNPARIMEKGIRTGRMGIIDRTVRPDFGAAPSVSDETAPEKAAS